MRLLGFALQTQLAAAVEEASLHRPENLEVLPVQPSIQNILLRTALH